MSAIGRREFLKRAAAAAGIAAMRALVPAQALGRELERDTGDRLRIACIADAHLSSGRDGRGRERALARAVAEINGLSPAPDFVVFGGDLSQTGGRAELQAGRAILAELRAPLRMVAGEHDWHGDLGAAWQELFGAADYSFECRGMHAVVLNNVRPSAAWIADHPGCADRISAVASSEPGADALEIGERTLGWIARDLQGISPHMPLLIVSHAPLYAYAPQWGFGCRDGARLLGLLARFRRVIALHAHTHHFAVARTGRVAHCAMPPLAWTWPYPRSGVPRATADAIGAARIEAAPATGWSMAEVEADSLARVTCAAFGGAFAAVSI